MDEEQKTTKGICPRCNTEEEFLIHLALGRKCKECGYKFKSGIHPRDDPEVKEPWVSLSKRKASNNTVIAKVKYLQGMAKALAKKQGLDSDDLVVLTVSIEKVVGDPVSYLLAQVIEE